MNTQKARNKPQKPERETIMKMSQSTVNAMIRNDIFNTLNVASIEGFQKINDRQYGVLVTDAEGNQRYARVGVIVAEMRDDMTAEELMNAEINDYKTKQDNKAKRAAERAEKAARDKAKREAAKKEEEKGE